jgi:hypothetical protein
MFVLAQVDMIYSPTTEHAMILMNVTIIMVDVSKCALMSLVLITVSVKMVFHYLVIQVAQLILV